MDDSLDVPNSPGLVDLLVITPAYPSLYKPYLDAQFADLVRAGHSLRILAARKEGAPFNAPVIDYRLDQLTRYYPTRLMHLPRTPLQGLRTGPALRGWRLAKELVGGSPKNRLLIGLRAGVAAPRPDVVLLHGTAAGLQFDWLADFWPNTPVGFYYHGGEVPGMPQIDDAILKHLFSSVDIVFSNTRFSTRQAADRGCPPGKLYVLPMGFDLEEFAPPYPRVYRRGGILRVASVGRLSREKGLAFAIKGIRHLHVQKKWDIEYRVVGEGPQRQKLEQHVAERGLSETVRFEGAVPGHRVKELLGEIDVLLLPSVPIGTWVETQATSVQQAMLMGALVVATDVGGVAESIPDEMKRFLVPPGDSEAIGKAIDAVRELPPGELSRIGQAGMDFVRSRYNISELNQRMLSVLRAVRP